ncbi:hypothetical protein K9N68_37450 (plasmid) [Kovacikia minuta CCNUW1]|uniref:hypothetical protein n=1 Tax=Kovacikia minuta TaxID=2931930 RepID=UPI001CCB7DA0|nr:hypothetical protein [Kovacikia minuta]UBF29900.1 hypothetical protein K9N68_37450 [Kovacikia minuta CCNUW1]
MEPEQALKDLVEAIKSGDRDQAEILLDAILIWKEKGGYMPEFSLELSKKN